MKDQFDLLDVLSEMREKFNQDPEVIESINKLKSKLKELESNSFTEEEMESEEFVEMLDMNYLQLRESDPDEFEIFDVLLLMS